MAPDVMSNVSSSVVAQSKSNFWLTLTTKGPTFKRSLSTQSPSRDLSDNLAFPIHDEHRYSGIG